MIESLSRPAKPDWIVGRVTALLAHFFVAQSDTRLQAAVLDDWCSVLRGRPAWAIARACVWWLGAENPNRSRKPMPGDIDARARVEMDGVSALMWRLERAERGDVLHIADQREERPELTPEEIERRRIAAAEIIKGVYGSGSVLVSGSLGQGEQGQADVSEGDRIPADDHSDGLSVGE